MSTEMNPPIQSLLEEIRSHDHLTPSLCKQLLLNSRVTAEDLMPWADFDHPKADSYGRKMVYDGGFFELMVMSWVDGDMAAIHDHGYTQWGAVKLFGPAEHAIFRQQDGHLSTLERKVFATGDVVAVGHDLIHQMGNVGQAPYLTLHLYGSYERDGDITADANLYDLYENQVQITCGGVFFDLPEEAVKKRLPGLTADFPTTLRDRVEALKRMTYAAGSLEAGAFRSSKEEKLAQWLFGAETWQKAEEEMAERTAQRGLETQRYLAVLRQELIAAANLQSALLEAGLGSGPLTDSAQLLAELLEQDDDSSTFARLYLDLMGDAFAIDFPVLKAA